MVAGRLTGTLDGRPVVIDANEAGLAVTVSTFRAAWSLQRSMRPLLPVLGILKQLDVPVRLKIGGMVSLQLLPKPGILTRLVAPTLADFA